MSVESVCFCSVFSFLFLSFPSRITQFCSAVERCLFPRLVRFCVHALPFFLLFLSLTEKVCSILARSPIEFRRCTTVCGRKSARAATKSAGRLLVRWCDRNAAFLSFVRSLCRSCVRFRAFVRSFFFSFFHLFMRTFPPSLLPSFIPSFIHVFFALLLAEQASSATATSARRCLCSASRSA